MIEQPKASVAERQWPGQVFADEKRDYTEAMLEFVKATREQQVSNVRVEAADEAPFERSLKEERRVLRQEATALGDQRRVVRQQRQVEDAAWQVLKRARRVEKESTSGDPPAERKAQADCWRAVRQQRTETLVARAAADETWRQQRLSLRQRWSQLPLVTAWIAILVITDNCTRQCLGLPLFVAGANVTSEMIVEALRHLLPPALLFLITDRGTHFTASAFQTLARSEEFIHVLIARHRPQSNGIAERFVRTLKAWLRDKTWQDDEELAVLLTQFLMDYNDRPHQGLPIAGLSPNEFANRIWLF
ncbi:MAG: transposase [Caldilineaceae bacterium]|nr:transposase [Caldilineaceae bacterium]